MPTYAYACKDCGHAFDIQQSFSEDSLTVCPECRGTLRKKFNSVGVVFKGSGFYRTDSRSTSSTVPAVATSGTSGSESGSTTSTAGASSSSADSTGSGGSNSSTAAKTPVTASTGS
ncbi:FmdB family zinc ribbon protein [Arthrobacter sp. Sr24]